MTDPSTFDEYLLLEDDLAEARQRIAELERWQQVDLENYKQHLAELTEMLTAATDVAVQRGKRIDELKLELTALCDLADLDRSKTFRGWLSAATVRTILDGADGG